MPSRPRTVPIIESRFRDAPGCETTIFRLVTPQQAHKRQKREHGERRPLDNTKGVNNLRKYLATAHMPSIARGDRRSPYALPIRGFCSRKNKLKVRYDADRHISRIRWYEQKAFEKATHRFNNDHVYGEEDKPHVGVFYARRREGEALCLPASLSPEETFPNTVCPSNISGTCEWLTTRAFKTLQRAIHLAFPDTRRWWMDDTPTDDPRNNQLWRTYLWSFHPDDRQEVWWRDVPPGSDSGKVAEPAPPNSMVFIIQSPWILAWQDLINVSRCKELPYLKDIGSGSIHKYSSRQRVWAKVLDTCQLHGTHYFVLTTHEGWIFGKFSDDWEDVDVSGVKEYNARIPTVMQTLVYWVAASMGIVGTSEMPPAIHYTADVAAAVAAAAEAAAAAVEAAEGTSGAFFLRNVGNDDDDD